MTTLLLIDDNRSLLQFTARNLSLAFPALEVITADSCGAAGEKARAHPPDLVVVDWLLPDGDGAGLLKGLSELRPGLRAIAVSAEPPAGLAGTLGVIEVLQKPFEADDLVAAVRRALDGSAPSAVAPAPKVELFDRHRALNRLSALLAGLRAFEGDLGASAEDPSAIRRLCAEYMERLLPLVEDVAAALKRCGGDKP